MDIDWDIVSSVATGVAAVVAALGLWFGAWQIKIGKDQAQATFEDSLDQQYRSLSMALPVNVLLGGKAEDADTAKIRELIFNYLDLSNEQVSRRVTGRISSATWKSWALGMKLHLNKQAFSDVYTEIKDRANFTYLDRLINSDFEIDPKSW